MPVALSETEAVAKAPPDGYTLLWVNSNYAINASLYKRLTYDPRRDFSPVSLVGSTAFILVAHPSLKANTVTDLVRLAHSKPGEINYASLGNGSGAHFAAELFKIKAKIDMTYIPYKGIAQAMPELLAGTVSVMFPNIGNAPPAHQGGTLAGARRDDSESVSAHAGSLPPFRRAALPAMSSVTGWGCWPRAARRHRRYPVWARQ